MNKIAIFNLPHLKLFETETGKLFLIIEDTEVFDFVEDFLIETHNIEYDFLQVDRTNNQTKYLVFFNSILKRASLIHALKQSSPIQLENIYKINN